MAATKSSQRVLHEVTAHSVTAALAHHRVVHCSNPVEPRRAMPYFSTHRSNAEMPPTLSPPCYKIARETVTIALLCCATPLTHVAPLLSQPPLTSDRPSSTVGYRPHLPECVSSSSQVTQLRNFSGVSCQIIFLYHNGLTIKSQL
jgi:hypothetical protein